MAEQHYVTDEEQAEKIKSWLKENGSSLITGLALGLAIIFGWQWWQGHRTAQAETASLHYEILVDAATARDTNRALTQLEILLDDFDNSPYAVLASLRMARLAVEQEQLERAADHLSWVLDNAQQPQLRDIARLRLARVELARERYDEALSQLQAIEGTGFTAQVAELRGDILAAQGQPLQAREAYQNALAAQGIEGTGLLQLKLDNLPVEE